VTWGKRRLEGSSR